MKGTTGITRKKYLRGMNFPTTLRAFLSCSDAFQPSSDDESVGKLHILVATH